MSDISSVVVIIPSLNPDEKLNMVVDGAINEGFTHLVLVNDGSDENHVARFEEAAKHPEVTVLTHEVNKGKGRALKTAFEYILENLPDMAGAITVDGDNQHTPKDTLYILPSRRMRSCPLRRSFCPLFMADDLTSPASVFMPPPVVKPPS